MSRSKTGMDREQRNETTQPDNEPRSANFNEPRGSESYPTGRESWREFPRRSSTQPFGRRAANEINSSTSRDYRDTVSGRAWASRTQERYAQEYGRAGNRKDYREAE